MSLTQTAAAQSGPVRLTYRVFNAGAGGQPLLMIMGLSGVKEDWRDLPEALAVDRPVAVFDNRGMGESDVPDGPYTMDQLAGDAEAVLDALAWPQAHVMGISMGGMIAQTLALRAPERIDRLVLGCTSDSGRFAPAPDRAVMNAMMPAPGTTPQEAAARALAVNYTPEWIEQDRDRFQALVDEATRYRRRAKDAGASPGNRALPCRGSPGAPHPAGPRHPRYGRPTHSLPQRRTPERTVAGGAFGGIAGLRSSVLAHGPGALAGIDPRLSGRSRLILAGLPCAAQRRGANLGRSAGV